jgi:hypothetical protein
MLDTLGLDLVGLCEFLEGFVQGQDIVGGTGTWVRIPEKTQWLTCFRLLRRLEG